ncbi:MAG: NYN domain-containing protein [Proteobacteria bacterium]|nr:NYN domain-containing protein [Pseudomonadota bacterium]
MKTFIYIDGFNFYYGAVKDSPYKWLDFKQLFSNILASDNQISCIKYFTARVSGKNDPDQPIRQQTYLRALEAYIPEISIYFVHFLHHEVAAPLARPTKNLRFSRVIKTEEKGSDVNLAVHLLNDAWLGLYDCAVVVSNDSDLAESMKLVKAQHNKVLGLVLPSQGRPSKQLAAYADFIKSVRKTTLAKSQLPNPIPGTNLRKPATW